jgi:hypothetical protein
MVPVGQLNSRNPGNSGRPVKVTALLLADHASVREGLLHVLGAGITRIARDPLPARLDVALALMFQADDEADLAATHNLEVVITESSPGSPGQQIAKVIAEMGVLPGVALIPGPNLQIPVVVPIQPVPVPRTGSYEIAISLDGEPVGSYWFEIVKGGDLRPATPPAG